ncbi:MAG: ankyrin repeat domain-containing protein [Alphaproteobacteria bacterium]|nr:MAG: ankyrin repeat domain-containing protein [Alphaproteobacteria bacterium]
MSKKDDKNWQKDFRKALKDKDCTALDTALKNGANPDVKVTIDGDQYGSALWYALIEEDLGLVKTLLKYDVNPNKKDADYSYLPLQYAVDEDLMDEALAIAMHEKLELFSKDTQEVYENAESNRDDDEEYDALYRCLKARIETAEGPWRKISNDSVQYTEFASAGMIEITDVFNFRSGKQTHIVRDFETETTTSSDCYFDDAPRAAHRFIGEAFTALQKADGGKGLTAHQFTGMRYVARRTVKRG